MQALQDFLFILTMIGMTVNLVSFGWSIIRQLLENKLQLRYMGWMNLTIGVMSMVIIAISFRR